MASGSSSRASSSSGSRSRRTSSSRTSQSCTGDYTYALADTSISEWLKCPVCLNPFLEPVQASGCEHTFCRQCISMHCRASHKKDESNTDSYVQHTDEEDFPCPTCRNTLRLPDLKPAAILIRNMVDSLMVKCPHQQRGCSYICERSFVDAHASKDCGWAWIGEYDEDRQVSGAGRGRCECGKRILRKDWPEHSKTGQCTVQRQPCPFADVPNGCHAMLREDEREDHLIVCPAKPVDCSYCGLRLQQREVEEHEGKCSEAPAACTMSRFGCLWTGSRHLYEDKHANDCPYTSIQGFLLKNEQELLDLRRDNAKLAQLCSSLDEQHCSMRSLVKQCLLSLGLDYPDTYNTLQLHQQRELDARLENSVPFPSQTAQAHPSSSSVTSSGRFGTTLGLSTLSTLSIQEVPTNSASAASASAPASLADLPWQWPDITSSYRHHDTSLTPNETISDSISKLQRDLASLSEKVKHFDRRIGENHVIGANASFEASRAHEELNSVRHGLHGLRISLLMQQQQQQQQRGVHPGQTSHAEGTGAMLPILGTPSNSIPFSAGTIPPIMGMRRFWNGYDQTKL